METQLLRISAIISGVFAITTLSALAQKTADKPITGDFKITIKTTVAGQDMEGTTMIKGPRERDENNINVGGMSMMKTVSISQCDLRRTIQINDQARKYLITPMDSTDSADAAAPAPSRPALRGGASGQQQGGIVTMTINTVDTGERKQMFGFTARHLKSTMSSESSPDACQQQQMKIERDGWYINLEYGLNCGKERPPQMAPQARGPRGCQDQFRFRHTGPTNLGFPLIETTTMYGPDGKESFTTKREVIELSRQQLDAALFDIPAGYTEAKSQDEMYTRPSVADMMKMAEQQEQKESRGRQSAPTPSADSEKRAGAIRVGVAAFNNKANASVSTGELRDRLIGEINGSGVEAIPLDASSLGEAQSEAKAKQCDYILLTDLSSLKTASAGKKLGGLIGRATGVDTGAGKSEAKLDFKLYPTGASSATLESSATGKEDTQEASVGAALDREAKAVVAAARKR